MDWNNIEHLIEKYYEGETTLVEEKQIRAALQRSDCPSDLKTEAEMMFFFQEEKTLESEHLQTDIGSLALATEQTLVPRNKKVKLFSLFSSLSGVAAALLLGALVFFGPNQKCNNNQPILAVVNNQKICDEQLARQEAKEALKLVAQKLNQGTSKLEYINTINTPRQIVN